MAFQDFMNKVRYWDNMISRWMMRHFYFMFFQFVLLIIFLFWFVNMFRVIDIADHVPTGDFASRILAVQSINVTLLVILVLLNSFWLLYTFNAIQRMHLVLKDISFNTSRFNKPPRNS